MGWLRHLLCQSATYGLDLYWSLNQKSWQVSNYYSSNLCPASIPKICVPAQEKINFHPLKPLLRSIQSHLPIHNWSAAEVASARHIFLMRRLIAPTLELDPARPKSNNEQLPANQYFDSKSSCLAPRELICTQRSIFWSDGRKFNDWARF